MFFKRITWNSLKNPCFFAFIKQIFNKSNLIDLNLTIFLNTYFNSKIVKLLLKHA